MAAKSKKESSKAKVATTESKARVTRITAKSDSGNKTKNTTKAKTKSTKATKVVKPKKKTIFTAIGGYFKGAWVELKQVRWPSRKATWGLTLAVIVFTAFFTTLTVLLDMGFQELFQLIIN